MKYKEVYAIIRFDKYKLGDDASKFIPDECIIIKKIVHSLDYAEKEVKRLNELNSNKGCMYYWQYTRLECDVDR